MPSTSRSYELLTGPDGTSSGAGRSTTPSPEKVPSRVPVALRATMATLCTRPVRVRETRARDAAGAQGLHVGDPGGGGGGEVGLEVDDTVASERGIEGAAGRVAVQLRRLADEEPVRRVHLDAHRVVERVDDLDRDPAVPGGVRDTVRVHPNDHVALLGGLVEVPAVHDGLPVRLHDHLPGGDVDRAGARVEADAPVTATEGRVEITRVSRRRRRWQQ